MKYLIFTLAMAGVIFCMSDAWMPWSNLIGVGLLVLTYFITKFVIEKEG